MAEFAISAAETDISTPERNLSLSESDISPPEETFSLSETNPSVYEPTSAPPVKHLRVSDEKISPPDRVSSHSNPIYLTVWLLRLDDHVLSFGLGFVKSVVEFLQDRGDVVIPLKGGG